MPTAISRGATLQRVFVVAWACVPLAGCRPVAQEAAPPATSRAAPVAAAVSPVPLVETYDCAFTEEPIAIDGKLDDPAWQRAVVIESFSMPWKAAADAPAVKATRARLLWDREHLYVAGDMEDADLYADITEHDGNTWENDVFELFLKPSAESAAYYEFHVTPANTRFDCFIPRRGHMNRFRRDGEFRLESAVTLRGSLNAWRDSDKGWTAELKIPWADLARTGGRPEPGDEWRFAVCRYDYDVDREQPELSTCVRLGRADFHRHEDYARLRFLPPNATGTGKPFGIPRIVPVTTSRVAGSPDPPPPYVVEQSHPAAEIRGPITVAHQPGSDRLLFVTEPWSYAPSQVMRMRDDPDEFAPELLLAEDGSVHYAIEFHPKFAENGFVYIGSNGPSKLVGTDGKPVRACRVTRYRIDPTPPYAFHADSAEVIIEWDSDGHNGAALAFGTDGMLYVSSGDGSTDSDVDLAGQDLTRLRSKIMRIDVDHPDDDVPGDGRAYSVPPDNPFVGQEGIRPETWAYGLRNPWRIAFDRQTGRVWAGDNGQDLWEYVWLVERGDNCGWSVMEGNHPFDKSRKAGPHPFAKPVVEHPHSEARSLTGGFVYTGSRLPELRGAYIYGDYQTGRIWGIRHDGTRVTWHALLADTPLLISGFGTDSAGELLIVQHAGGKVGGFYRLVPRPPATGNEPPFPRKLSESGLFASVRDHRMADGVVPYDVNSPLWSDGTHKARFFALPTAAGTDGQPASTPIDVTNSRGWNFPDGTVLVKSFAIDATEGDAATRRWIETRFMVRQQGEWAGYSYEWNDDQTDAELVADAGKDRDFQVRSADLAADSSGVRTLAWRYPSRTECMVCHSAGSNFVLGLCTVQLNRDFDYEAVLGPGHHVDNQLRTLEHLGLLRVNWWGDTREGLEAVARTKGLDEIPARVWAGRQMGSRDDAVFAKRRSTLFMRPPEQTNRLANPRDASLDLADRARSYLQSNCASCHVMFGGGNAQISMEFLSAYDKLPLAHMQAIDVEPIHARLGIENAKLIAPGEPDRSVLLARVARRGPGQMPALATRVVDEPAVALLREWITSLESAPAK
jgi:glucose/arabinose dehydrogenase/mono/diheme cytochrome c family protein